MKSIDEMMQDPRYRSQTDWWFAWYPVRTGALGTGPLKWFKKLWRNRCCGVTIYQDPSTFKYPLTVDEK